MTNQADLVDVEFDAKGYAARIAHVIYLSGLNQSEFAKQLGISAAIVSDAVRGLKKPGAEILFRIKTVFGVSTDWLLTGEGSFSGNHAIDPELFHDIRTQVEIVKVAIIDGNAIAQKIMLLLQSGLMEQAVSDSEMAGFLEKLSLNDSNLTLAIELYNEFIQTENSAERRKNLLNTAVSKLQIRKPIDALTRLIQSPATNVHFNIIGTQRNAGRSFRKR
jgi:transcriptional regulator with XRE-family HTH domain